MSPSVQRGAGAVLGWIGRISGATMAKIELKPVVQNPLPAADKPLSRGQRIHRRRTLALKRRTDKAEAVTNRE
jgi:hypothetical protein